MNASTNYFASKGFKITLKMFFVLFLGISMLILTSLIEGVINSRESYRTEATNSITQAWGAQQTVTPPVLTIPFTTNKPASGKQAAETTTGYLHLFPEKLNIEAKLQPELKHKGIFNKVVYNSDLKISGNFPIPTSFINSLKDSNKTILWNSAYIALGVKDLKGLSGEPSIVIDGSTKYFQPGAKQQSAISEGIHTQIDLTPLKDKISNFSLNLSLKGSDELNFVPTGKRTIVVMKSSWPNPSFQGGFLPSTKTISNKGFTANWDVSYLARNFPQAWTNDTVNQDILNKSLVGVSLIPSIDFYRNCLRAVKYAILFVALTFITFFMFEIVAKIRLHAFQYILVGVAISIFYLLLLSLSEFIGFNWAYLLASICNISLISSYTRAILQKVKPILNWFMLGILTFLYSFLYVLLQLQDLSLLLGSLGLFIILGAVMHFTKNINWYENENASKISEETPN